MLSNGDKTSPPSASSLPLGAAAQVAITLYEKMTGNAYSEADIKRLTELKHLYQEVIQNSAPISWELDDKNRPTHRIDYRKWPSHVRQLSKGKHKVGRFHYQSTLIAELGSTYLVSRGQRWIGSGTPGDVLEQFISEMVHYAINELPTLGFDAESVEKIYQRIKYLDKIQKHEFLFKFGTVTRERNKFDTIESMKQQLYSSAEFAAKECKRQCAREKLESCTQSTSRLLLACAKFMYYGRETNISLVPLELQCYIDPTNSFLSISTKNLYPEVKKTHTGAMLDEFVSLAGLESFGVKDNGNKSKINPKYFKENYSPQPVNWKLGKNDLPPWVQSEDAMATCLEDSQKMLESALRLAQLKRLAEEAYDLTGKIGDVWAYGDKEGKLSLEALLFLLEKELAIFNERFNKLYHYHNKHRHRHTYDTRVNQTPANLNFNKVDEQHDDIQKDCKLLTNAIKDIRDSMLAFSEDEIKQIDDKKKSFYKSIADYLKQYYPNECPKYKLIEDSALLEDKSTDSQEALLTHIKEYPHSLSNKKYLEDEKFKEWRAKFIDRYPDLHLAAEQANSQFQSKIAAQQSMAELHSAAMALKQQVDLLKEKAEEERPVWSMSSMGWPFHRRIRKSINKIIADLNTLLKEVGTTVGSEEPFDLSSSKAASGSSTQNINGKVIARKNSHQDKEDKPAAPMKTQIAIASISTSSSFHRNTPKPQKNTSSEVGQKRSLLA